MRRAFTDTSRPTERICFGDPCLRNSVSVGGCAHPTSTTRYAAAAVLSHVMLREWGGVGALTRSSSHSVHRTHKQRHHRTECGIIFPRHIHPHPTHPQTAAAARPPAPLRCWLNSPQGAAYRSALRSGESHANTRTRSTLTEKYAIDFPRAATTEWRALARTHAKIPRLYSMHAVAILLII